MQRTARLLVPFVFAFLLMPARSSWGWIDTGHKMVALVAWEDLTPKTRAAVTELLKKHPQYQKYLLANLPEGSTREQTDRFAFATAATWPDLVRSKANPMNVLYNHPNWHFIDIPIVADGVEVPPATQPSGPGPKNILEALAQVTAELKDPAPATDQKAVDVCWVAHLVGDIHQPLHTTTYYSKELPNGDKGGNDDWVLHDPPYYDSRMKLHLLWDELPGNFQSLQIDGYVAQGLRNDPQYSREKLKPLLDVKEFDAWARESHQLADDVAYQHGQLKVFRTDAFHPPAGSTIPGVPPDYLAKAETTAMHQVVLAGYRLADVLNSIFDPKP